MALVGREKVIAAVLGFLLKHGAHVAASEIETLFAEVHKEFRKEAPGFLRVLPGVEKLLKALKGQNVRMAVVTSDAVANTREVLDSLGLLSFFSVVIGRESTKEPKESGVPAKIAVSQMGSETGKVIVIGDAPVDLVMAQQASLKAGVAVSTGQVPYENLCVLTPFALHGFDELFVKQ